MNAALDKVSHGIQRAVVGKVMDKWVGSLQKDKQETRIKGIELMQKFWKRD